MRGDEHTRAAGDTQGHDTRTEREVRSALKRALYARAPLFVKMREMIRRELRDESRAERNPQEDAPHA